MKRRNFIQAGFTALASTAVLTPSFSQKNQAAAKPFKLNYAR